jgi:hypothetical protein
MRSLGEGRRELSGCSYHHTAIRKGSKEKAAHAPHSFVLFIRDKKFLEPRSLFCEDI